MLTKLHPLQVENQLENNNTVWRTTRCNIQGANIFYASKIHFILTKRVFDKIFENSKN